MICPEMKLDLYKRPFNKYAKNAKTAKTVFFYPNPPPYVLIRNDNSVSIYSLTLPLRKDFKKNI